MKWFQSNITADERKWNGCSTLWSLVSEFRLVQSCRLCLACHFFGTYTSKVMFLWYAALCISVFQYYENRLKLNALDRTVKVATTCGGLLWVEPMSSTFRPSTLHETKNEEFWTDRNIKIVREWWWGTFAKHMQKTILVTFLYFNNTEEPG